MFTPCPPRYRAAFACSAILYPQGRCRGLLPFYSFLGYLPTARRRDPYGLTAFRSAYSGWFSDLLYPGGVFDPTVVGKRLQALSGLTGLPYPLILYPWRFRSPYKRAACNALFAKPK